jgi:Alternative splicing regulator
LNYLTIEGRPAKVHRSIEHYNAAEKEEGLIPWNGHPDIKIDRFDGRSLLDFYKEPDPKVIQHNAANKGHQELKLEEVSIHDYILLCSG